VSSKKKKWKTIWNIPRLLRTSWIMLKNPGVPADIKIIALLLGLGYFVWPLDLIPDIPLPFVGYIDDFSIIFFILNWFVNRSVREEHIQAEYYFVDNDNENKEK